ncbi:MAG TPA: flagellar biosynthetic protein FliR [Polyangiaceae bacterium]|nr:flagellar biosynthetic protein FliR [Polyangiaceae bacterium]
MNAAAVFSHAPATSLLGAVIRAFAEEGVDLSALGLAWARALPTVALVPAFGMRALPSPVRVVLALTLALCIFPAAAVGHGIPAHEPWPLLVLENVLRGVPIALAAAIPLWAATMAGNLVDSLRGTTDMWNFEPFAGKTSHLGMLFALLAATLFLESGGPSRVALALATSELPAHPILAAVRDLVAGLTLAVALAGPLLAASLVLEVAASLVARAAYPAQIHALFPPLRALVLLIVIAAVLDRIAVVLGRALP